MKKIKLTQGYVALVDNKDFQRVKQYKWHARVERRKDGSICNVYAQRALPMGKGTPKGHKEQLHRFVLGIKNHTPVQVDHFPDYSGLNCQRKNLRIATRMENARNCRLYYGSTSKHKGVTWHKSSKKWQAKIVVDKKSIYLGLFKDIKQAAKAYDTAALLYFGRFAKTNIMEGLL